MVPKYNKQTGQPEYPKGTWKTKEGNWSFRGKDSGLDCLAKFDLSLDKCSTCCCKGPIVKSSLKSKLVIDDHHYCQTWFSTLADPWIRVTNLFMGSFVNLLYLSTPCYEPLWKMKNRGKKGEMLGEEEAVGRRAGGMSNSGATALQLGG